MRIQIVSRGITAPLAQSLLGALAEYNADVYRRDSALPSILELPVRYVPDGIGRSIDLVAVDAMSRRRGDGLRERVSCGSAAAAWAGWHIARSRAVVLEMEDRGPGRWHAFATCGSARFDPELHMGVTGNVAGAPGGNRR